LPLYLMSQINPHHKSYHYANLKLAFFFFYLAGVPVLLLSHHPHW